ncbi:hypothetical protein QBC46DRAFT_441437 [Diplogelasinospora grovesii]|uniref:Uncharacterized protein n=1 Tax=Diplogelasinospora grovesii TaxID=303347 RepID=A0AAN6N315_9PEZI|nr:hypothetical protein QBC46DRAFT_441437 [Diplogelasinospora grovesii]
MERSVKMEMQVSLRRPATQPPTIGIRRLPVEVVTGVLATLDSTKDLISAIRSHRVFFNGFHSYQQRVLKGIMIHMIPREILPLAIATHEAALLVDIEIWEEIQPLILSLLSIINSTSPESSPLYPRVTLQLATALEKTHRMVEYFTNDYVASAIPALNDLFGASKGKNVSAVERCRLYRAFYRFQLYCNIYGRHAIEKTRRAVRRTHAWHAATYRRSDEDTRRELACFFHPWPPWMNEQLACVFEYLETKLSVVFNDVAAHDVEWGWKKIDWVSWTVAVPTRRFMLLHGIPFLHELTTSSDFQHWKELLDSAYMQRRFNASVGSSGNPLEDSLRRCRNQEQLDVAAQNRRQTGEPLLGEYDVGMLRALVPARGQWEGGIDDVTTLAVQLWKHAHHYRRGSQMAVFLDRLRFLRETGYIFWDGPLVRDSNAPDPRRKVRNPAWNPNRIPRRDEVQQQTKEMHDSWKIRRDIFLEGGSGYWAPGSGSRVVYQYL